MIWNKTLLGGALIVGVGLALAYSAWQLRTSFDSQYCYACGRPVHARMRTIGLVNGAKEIFCCPTCAFSLHEQTGESVRITGLADFSTAKKLDPGQAVMVEGSDLNLCVRDHVLVSQNKQISPMEFDRCSPSMIAFAGRQEADRFAGEHGGIVVSFAELAASYQRVQHGVQKTAAGP
jgi:hypothetical protein